MSKHGKFRVERGAFIFLCHCKYLQDFRLPMEHLDFLRRLAGEGVAADEELSEVQAALIEDLRATLLLDGTAPTGAHEREQAAALWDRVAYNEDM